MGGELLYEAPRRHVCDVPVPGTLDSVWRCDCGAYWRMQTISPGTRTRWMPMGCLAVWWWRRRQR